MGRPSGSKNKRTLAIEQRVREAADKAAVAAKQTNDPVMLMDSLAILRAAMRYFYRKHLQALALTEPDEVAARDHLLDATSVADKAIPYEHHRLAHVKMDKDSSKSDINGLTADELRAGIVADIAALQLVSIPTGVANRVSKGNDTSH
jgi:hypothetical protein